ncbi:MAG: TonB-dependent receptor plug domain-containing protein [Desulfobacterales bacterium]|nr:TonB-dependent receptor plug domain-containing protein [Desulfobacterales bacterium]
MKSLAQSLRLLALITSILMWHGPAPGFTSDLTSVDEMFEMSLEELLDVEVSIATRFPMASEGAPAIVSVVTAGEIRNMGARNIIDIPRTVPGFDLTYIIPNAHHQGSVRGINPGKYENSIVILMNGHTLGAGKFTGSAGYFFDVIPVDNIKKIEIIRGPGYGWSP